MVIKDVGGVIEEVLSPIDLGEKGGFLFPPPVTPPPCFLFTIMGGHGFPTCLRILDKSGGGGGLRCNAPNNPPPSTGEKMMGIAHHLFLTACT